jgi:hypothetical protein
MFAISQIQTEIVQSEIERKQKFPCSLSNERL